VNWSVCAGGGGCWAHAGAVWAAIKAMMLIADIARFMKNKSMHLFGPDEEDMGQRRWAMDI
jgi:hypothetical protein